MTVQRQDGTETNALECWITGYARARWIAVQRTAVLCEDAETYRAAEAELKQLPEITLMDALSANRQLVDLLLAGRRHLVRLADEHGLRLDGTP